MAAPRGSRSSASIRSIRCRWPMKLIFSMPGRAVGDAGAGEQRVRPARRTRRRRRRWRPCRRGSTWMAFTPGEGDLGEVHHHDLGAGVLDQLGGGGTHAGGTTDDQRSLAVVAERVEQAHVMLLLDGRSVWWIGVAISGQATTPRTLRSTMVSQSSPSSARMASPCSLNSGARPGVAGSSSNWTGAATSWNGHPGRGLAVLEVAVGHGLRVDGRLERVLHHRPLPVEVGEARPPLLERAPTAKTSVSACDRLDVVGHERRRGRRSGDRSPGRAGRRPRRAPGQYLPACRQVNDEDAAVLRVVVPRQRVGRRAASAGGAVHGTPEHEREGHRLAHGPQPDAEQRHVDDRRLAGALPVEERAHDPAGDRHAADRVTEAGGGRHRDQVVLRALGADGDAGPGPERERVVGALVGVGSPLALAGAPHVDDGRVVGADLVDVDLELRAHARAACW